MGMHRAHDSEITDDDRTLIRLLVAGLADRQIAARLNVAERTLQRRLHSVMVRLGVINRCQLGALAALNGWVDWQTIAE
jgi:DNA-binding NarL/FixJ family response regulator